MWQYFAGLDTAVSAWVALHRTPFATAFMRAMTLLGSSGGMALLGLLAAGIFVWQKRRRQALTVVASLAGSWLANELLKALFHRQRPGGLWLTPATGYSFPSGHAMVSMSFLLVMAQLLGAGQPARQRWLLTAGAVIVSGLIGASRVYLGVHYASDVLGGWIGGALWAWVCLRSVRASIAPQRSVGG